ncbi:hypothetical protein WDU94_013936 [Cyamophila willieti]
MDYLKQILAVKKLRLQRNTKNTRRKVDNKKFNGNQKAFYNSLCQTTENEEEGEIPTEDAMETYWKNIWGRSKEYNKQAEWVNEIKVHCENIPTMEAPTFTSSELQSVIGKLHNWKATGVDKIHNFWWKYLSAIHSKLLDILNLMLVDPNKIPPNLTKGITYMKPKGIYSADPSKYRPITCLNTMYKIFTSLITNKITQHLENNNILAPEQKGCKKGSRGCKDQIIIDEIITGQIRGNNRNAALAWIDYKKAYDSIPHSWLIEVLDVYKIHPQLKSTLTKCMKNWKTDMIVQKPNRNQERTNFSIECGIFQGDGLSPIWFCMAINALSYLLKRSGMGVAVKTSRGTEETISHLLYMDDLKIYAKNKQQLTSMLNTVYKFSKDIGMEFGLDKCAQIVIKHGKVEDPTPLVLMESLININHVDETQLYKYLGIKQYLNINHTEIKKEIREEYRRRVNAILKTGLNSKHLIMAVNSYCVPVLTYSFGLIKWTLTDVTSLDTETRVLLTKHRMHHPKSSKERLYLPRNLGGRGLMNIEGQWRNQTNKLGKYFLDLSQKSTMIKNLCTADENYTPLNLKQLSTQNTSPYNINTKVAEWRGKELHGRFPSELDKTHKEESVYYLKAGNLYPETEGFITAIQDQVITTKNYRKYILKERLENDRCRLCGSSSETIQHLTSGCQTLAGTDYMHRHNLSCKIIYQYLARRDRHNIDNTPYYQHNPAPVIENSKSKIYWDRTVHSETYLSHNRPDITYLDKEAKCAYLIDVAHPADHNLNDKEKEKIAKYLPLAAEMKALYNLQAVTIVPIIISTNGLISTQTIKKAWQLKIPRKVIFKAQQNAIIETCTIVRKVLNIPVN